MSCIAQYDGVQYCGQVEGAGHGAAVLTKHELTDSFSPIAYDADALSTSHDHEASCKQASQLTD